MLSHHSSRVTALLFLALGAAGPASAQKARNITPQCGSVFGGQICIGGTALGSNIKSLTATIPLSVIQAAPAPGPNPQMKWPPEAALVVKVPEEIRAATGVNHFTFYWEAMGHPPATFLNPHFDFHFYVVDNAARQAMDCKNDKKAERLPAGYSLNDIAVPGLGVLKGVCVPLMGMHSLLGTDAASKSPFTSTLVLGFYDAKPIFFEPMISKAALMQKKSFSLRVPTPRGLPPNVHYPRQFRAKWDAATQGYLFEFTGFQ